MLPSRLRVAVLIDAPHLPAWLHHALVNALASGSAELVLAVLDASAKAPRPGPRGAAFRTYEALDRRFFLFPRDHSLRVDASPLLASCARLSLTPRRQGGAWTLDPSALDAIRAARPDLILKLGFPPLEGDVLGAAALGVWSFDHEERARRGAPALAWEVFRGSPVAEVCLRARDAGGSRVLRRSILTVDPNSLHRTRNAVLWKCAGVLGQALRDAQDPVGIADATLPVPACDAPLRAPRALEVARFALSAAARIVRSRWRRRTADHLWFIALRRSGPSLLDGPLSGFAPVPMPPGRFYADPFLVAERGRHWLFFEDASVASGKGSLRCAELRPDGALGESRLILERGYHLSYPFVFPWRGQWLMLPETSENRTIELWRASEFPWCWELDDVLFKNVHAVDPTLVEEGGRLWLFTAMSESSGASEDDLFLFHADSPRGPWLPHPRNPVVSDLRRARPAGRLFRENGRLYRPAQDASGEYGSAIWIHRVDVLDERSYRETPVRRIDAGWWPGATGTHSLDRAGDFDAIDAKSWVPRGRTV